MPRASTAATIPASEALASAAPRPCIRVPTISAPKGSCRQALRLPTGTVSMWEVKRRSGCPEPSRAMTLGLRSSSLRIWKSTLLPRSRAAMRSATFRVSPGGFVDSARTRPARKPMIEARRRSICSTIV